MEDLDEFEKKLLDMDVPMKHFISSQEREISWKEILNQVDRPVRIVRTMGIAALAAVLALSVTAGWWYYLKDAVFKASDGEKLSVSLPDGSSVTLNSNSQLKLLDDFDGAERKVRLKGEAFFNVAKDQSRPFVVDVGGSQVQVTGTSFNINYTDRLLAVSVVTGSVTVASSRGEMSVSKNQKIVVSDDGDLSLTEWEENDLAWYSGELVIDNKTIAEIAALLEKLFDKKVKVAESIAGCRMSAKIKYETINDVLQLIEDTLDVKWRYESNHVFIYGKGC